MDTKIECKKVFFVYPHSVFQENLIQWLVDLEYEIYTLNNHSLIPHILEIYPDSVFFLNIDTRLSRPEWESFIRELKDSGDELPVSLGILSYEFDPKLAELYLIELALPCGYVQLKQKLDDAADIITKTLIVNEVKSRRKYVRYQVRGNSALKFNAGINGKIRNGLGLDISSAGMAVVFDDPEVDIKKNTLLSDIQLNLAGRRVKVSGVVIGFRQDDEKERRVFVILFDKTVETKDRRIIRNYVHLQLQQVMMKRLEK